MYEKNTVLMNNTEGKSYLQYVGLFSGDLPIEHEHDEFFEKNNLKMLLWERRIHFWRY